MRTNIILKALICVIAISTCLVACNLPKPFVGSMADTSSDMWCKVKLNSPGCTIQSGTFSILIVIKESKEPGVYTASGTIDASRGDVKSFDNVIKANFILLLAKDSVITDYIPVNLLDNDLKKPMRFIREFKTEPFDAATMIWDCIVRG